MQHDAPSSTGSSADAPNWREKLKHAFHVDPPGPAQPTPEQQPAVDWICRKIVERGVSLPGVVALEVAKPLNYLGSQFMQAASPILWSIAREQTHDAYLHFAQFMEHRGAMDYLIDRIEDLQAERDLARKQTRDERRGDSVPPSEEEASSS